MNYKIIFTCSLLLACFLLHAQNDKVRLAVFDPTSSGTGIDEGTRMAVREIISSTFVNTGKYTIVERSLIEKIMQEQKFSISGAVEDSQATEIGKILGANKIVLSVISLAGGRNVLSIKLVDVQTANVERQKTQVITSNELLNVVEPLTLQLMGEEVGSVRQTPITEITNTQKTENIINEPVTIPSAPSATQRYLQNETGMLVAASRGDVLLKGRKLSKYEVREIMANTNALQLYNTGLSKHKSGTITKTFGGVVFLVGAMIFLSTIDIDEDGMTVGAAMAAVGGATFIIGSVTKSSGKRYIRSAVDSYNRTYTSYNVEFGVGIHKNGLGLVINF